MLEDVLEPRPLRHDVDAAQAALLLLHHELLDVLRGVLEALSALDLFAVDVDVPAGEGLGPDLAAEALPDVKLLPSEGPDASPSGGVSRG